MTLEEAIDHNIDNAQLRYALKDIINKIRGSDVKLYVTRAAVFGDHPKFILQKRTANPPDKLQAWNFEDVCTLTQDQAWKMVREGVASPKFPDDFGGAVKVVNGLETLEGPLKGRVIVMNHHTSARVVISETGGNLMVTVENP